MNCKILISLTLVAALSSCMKNDNHDTEEFEYSGKGLLIGNEGNFSQPTATLSYYFPDEQRVENEIFSRVNAIPVGDVLQSITGRGNDLYLTVNNSGVIHVIDKNTLAVKGQITNLTSPRYVHFVSNEKGYISDLKNGKITIFNPTTYKITGSINTKHVSNEQMIAYKDQLLVNCWSMDKKVLIINTKTDAIVDSIETGIQPAFILLDKNNKLWVLNDGGGWPENPVGYENPSLWCIDIPTKRVEKKLSFPMGAYFPEICLNNTKDTLYYINGDLWKMAITATALPEKSFIPANGRSFYALAVDPDNADIYLSDVIDYAQHGMIYRYSQHAELIHSFRAGISPGNFYFKK